MLESASQEQCKNLGWVLICCRQWILLGCPRSAGYQGEVIGVGQRHRMGSNPQRQGRDHPFRALCETFECESSYRAIF